MNMIDRILGLIAPDECLSCSLEGSVLCTECAERDLKPYAAGICYSCGKLSKNFKTCTECTGYYKPEHVWIATEYSGTAKKLVQAYKFSYKRRVASLLAQYINDILPYFAEQPVTVVVPTAPPHVRARGFDHALLITKELCKLRGWYFWPVLARHNNNQQHSLGRKDRIAQIKGSFRMFRGVKVSNRHVLLIDDVTTTGATLNECAKMLKKAGASRVDAVVFARTPKQLLDIRC